MSVPGNAADGDQLLRLRTENQQLRRELLALRQFIDSMQNVMEACESPRQDSEIIELLTQVLDNCLETIDADDGSLLVVDEDTGDLVFVIARGEIPQERLAWRRLPPGEGIAGWVVAHRRPTIVNNARADDRFYDVIDSEFNFRTRSVLAVPLTGGGRVLGVIEVLNKRDGNLFATADQTLLTLMCRFAGELLYALIRQNAEITGSRRKPSTV